MKTAILIAALVTLLVGCNKAQEGPSPETAPADEKRLATPASDTTNAEVNEPYAAPAADAAAAPGDAAAAPADAAADGPPIDPNNPGGPQAMPKQ